VNIFDKESKWNKNLQVWGEAAVVTVEKDSKTGDKGTTMFIRYDEYKSGSFVM
jgi:hypothetical protein